MKVNFEDGCYEFNCEIESKDEIEIVKNHAMASYGLSESDLLDPEESYAENLCVGGSWPYFLSDLHSLVVRGVKLHGLPDWLKIS